MAEETTVLSPAEWILYREPVLGNKGKDIRHLCACVCRKRLTVLWDCFVKILRRVLLTKCEKILKTLINATIFLISKVDLHFNWNVTQ